MLPFSILFSTVTIQVFLQQFKGDLCEFEKPQFCFKNGFFPSLNGPIHSNKQNTKEFGQVEEKTIHFFIFFITASETIPGNMKPEWKAGVNVTPPDEDDENSGTGI